MMNQNEAMKLKQQGNIAYKNKDYIKAIHLYTKAIHLHPSDASFYSNRALSYFNLGQYQKCIEDCSKATTINPTLGKAYKKKAAAQANLLKFVDAVQTMKNAVNCQKDNLATKNQLEEYQHYLSNFNRYQQAEKNNDYAQALSCVTFIANKFPQSKVLKMYRIQALAKTGATDEADKLLKQIPHSNDPDLFYLKGLIELYSGDSGKAKNHFVQGLQFQPDHLKCKECLHKAKACEKLKQQGNQLTKSGKYAEAEAKYTETINLDPFNKKMNSIVYSNRALTFMKRKQNLKALDDLNKSLDLNPNYTKSLMRRAEVNMQIENYTAAIQDYSKIQQLDPSSNLKAKIQQAKKKQKVARKKDYYAILQIKKQATDDQIKKAYKKLALKYHPDRNNDKSQAQKNEATKKFKDVAQAYACLSDKQKRKKYDIGGMDFDGDFGDAGAGGFSGFSNMPGGTFRMSSNMGGMGGMGGIDPNQIFSMFFKDSGMGGMGGFGGFGGMGGMGGKKGASFGAGHGDMDFDDFGGFGNFGSFGNKFGNFSADFGKANNGGKSTSSNQNKKK